MVATLYYVHDPMCSWCWAFQPSLKTLVNNLPDNIHLVRLLGGLAPDSDVPMSDEIRDYVIGNWKRIEEQVPGTVFNYDFWKVCKPRRSTYPACRAVISARLQGKNHDEKMTEAIQHAYYLHARNPSEFSTLVELADEIGLDRISFQNDIKSRRVDETLKREIELAHQLNLKSFPGLMLEIMDKCIRIEVEYRNPETILSQIYSHIG